MIPGCVFQLLALFVIIGPQGELKGQGSGYEIVSVASKSGYSSPPARRIQCSPRSFCTQKTRVSFEKMQHTARELEALAKLEDEPLLVNINDPSVLDLLETRRFLCADESFSGFLFDNYTSQWDTVCAWSGNELNVSCTIAPMPSNLPYTYMKKDEWRRKVGEFRMRIGCPWQDMVNLEDVGELHLCSERCMQAGIGYLTSVIMMTTASFAFIYICIQQQN